PLQATVYSLRSLQCFCRSMTRSCRELKCPRAAVRSSVVDGPSGSHTFPRIRKEDLSHLLRREQALQSWTSGTVSSSVLASSLCRPESTTGNRLVRSKIYSIRTRSASLHPFTRRSNENAISQ